MVFLDWMIVFGYVLFTILIGIYFTKKSSENTDEFFIAGRSLSWIVAGTSLVATTFSADTPLLVAGMSRGQGISSNWFWWSLAIGHLASVFFFAKLWRRTGVVTDIQFLIKRYPAGRARDILRVFKVFLDGVLINCIIVASVTLAISKIAIVMLNLSEDPLFHLPVIGGISSINLLVIILGASALIYSVLSGFYGVVYTDLVQFTIALSCSVLLAVMVYIDASGGEGMMSKLQASPDFNSALLNFFPNLGSFNLLTVTFFVYIFMTWWASAPGSGWMVQRMLATRSEQDSLWGFLWYNFCHYCLRPWPWIVVGILSLHYIPHLDDSEMAFPHMVNEFLPVGLKGLMVTSMLAAFMSTIDTHLNWGASYLITDFYKPYLVKNAAAKHYVMVSRISMIVLMLVAFFITLRLQSILGVYKYVSLIVGGSGTVMIARWYWWRVNAYSEITAIISSFIIGNTLVLTLPDTPERSFFAIRLAVTIPTVTLIWVVVTLLMSKEPSDQAIAFYSKMKIGGWGWNRIRQLTAIQPKRGELQNNFLAWILSVISLFSFLIGVGKLLFHQWSFAAISLTIAVLCGYRLAKVLKKVRLS